MKITYQTSDIYLSAALRLNNFKLIDIKKNSKGRGFFEWEDRPDRVEITRNFFAGQLVGSLKGYVDAWMALKNAVEMTPRSEDKE